METDVHSDFAMEALDRVLDAGLVSEQLISLLLNVGGVRLTDAQRAQVLRLQKLRSEILQEVKLIVRRGRGDGV